MTESQEKVLEAANRLAHTIGTDYSALRDPRELYEKEMRKYSLSEACIDDLIKLYFAVLDNK